MNDYTPTTDEVRNDYLRHGRHSEKADEFDRFLARHDAEVAARMREKIANEILAAPFGLHFLQGHERETVAVFIRNIGESND